MRVIFAGSRELWAEQNGVPIERYSPDWNQYGKRAGMIRNDYMAQRADSLIALWDGQKAWIEISRLDERKS